MYKTSMDKTKESDDELVARFKNGDVSAFDLIVQRYKAPLNNFVSRFLYDHESAEDITQEIFIRIYKNINNYKSDIAEFRTWIYKIASNLCKNELRNLERRSKILINVTSSDQKDNINLLEGIQDMSFGPDKQLEEKELQDIISKAISRLPEKFRAIIILRDIENMSYEEIAKIINKPLGTVKSRINRARLMLKDKLEAYV